MARLKWLEPKKPYPKRTPANFDLLVSRRKPIGQNGAARCVVTARSTGEQCRNPAMTGTCACLQHGGLRWALVRAKERDPDAKAYVSPAKAKRRQEAGVAFADACGIELPQALKKRVPDEHVGARGRRIAAALNRDLNR